MLYTSEYSFPSLWPSKFWFSYIFLDNLQAAKLGDPEMAIATVIKYLNLISCFKFMIFHLESTFISKAHLPRWNLSFVLGEMQKVGLIDLLIS